MKKPKLIKPQYHPRCPVCGARLEGIGWPIPKKGKGRCPAAGMYDFEVETDENKAVVKKDKEGNLYRDIGYKIDPDGDDLHGNK